MSRPACSVVFSTYNRNHLLALSIEGYNRMLFPLDRLQVVVVDDGGEDSAAPLMERFDPRIDVVYLRLRKPPGLWRDVAASINYGIRAASGAVVAVTHPEIHPGRESLSWCCETLSAHPESWASCKGYYLSPRDQERLETVDWRSDPLNVRKIEGFYDPRDGHPDYHPAAIDQVGKPGYIHNVWNSWIWGAMTRRSWSHFSGFIPTASWGSCDLLLLQRRQKLGIPNVTGVADKTIVLHFNHDIPVGAFVPTNRDIKACHDNAPALTPEQCRFPSVDEIWGPYP